ncbi:hypothetical protein [Aequorivita sp. Q41]|uniref:hypothetical protein n=1 Tax=Aequorivita sp. Q41 TaxID=3153300 RepID=UPI003242670A
MKTKFIIYILTLLGLVPLGFWCFYYIDYDLWYDEVYSLEEFALQGFSTTMFYYPAPNNHIFYNLTSLIISKVFGLRDIFSVEAHVYIFRSFQLVISLLTAFFSVRILKQFFGYKSSFLLYAILFTTIPYMNFSLQLRGYNMSALFLVMLVYYSWNYISAKKTLSLFMVLISSMLLLYTIPSNLYALVAFWLILFSSWFYYFKKSATISKFYLKPLTYISIGVVLTFLLYLPILEDVIFNKYSNSKPMTFLFSFYVLKITSIGFFSNRFFLLLLFLPGIYVFYKKSSFNEKYYFLSLAALCFLPFFLSFLHQKGPFPRVFVPLAPIFCMVFTIVLVKFIDSLALYQTRILQILVSLYCAFVFINEFDKNDTLISKSMVEANVEPQGLSRNFYLGSFYKQDETMKLLGDVYKDYPVVKLYQRDKPSTDLYLRKYKIPFTEIDTLSDISPKLKTYGKVYILTSYKKNILSELKNCDSLEASVLTPEYSFTNIIEVTTKAK